MCLSRHASIPRYRVADLILLVDISQFRTRADYLHMIDALFLLDAVVLTTHSQFYYKVAN